MGTIVDITTSLDGFVAGPNPTLEDPLGEGGERLHEWAVALEAFRECHGMEGGETSADSERLRESVDATGAVVMGRRMFSGGEGPWDTDPNADGWWGDDPPFKAGLVDELRLHLAPILLGSGTGCWTISATSSSSAPQ